MYNKWTIQAVHISEPDISSPAALSLLTRIYYSLDKTIYSNFRMKRIRDRWMKLQMQTPDEKGGLTCAICGRKGLKPFRVRKHKVATLDHIVPIVEGGSWKDPQNFQIACNRCNNDKDTLRQKNKSLTLKDCVV